MWGNLDLKDSSQQISFFSVRNACVCLTEGRVFPLREILLSPIASLVDKPWKWNFSFTMNLNQFKFLFANLCLKEIMSRKFKIIQLRLKELKNVCGFLHRSECESCTVRIKTGEQMLCGLTLCRSELSWDCFSLGCTLLFSSSKKTQKTNY